MTKSPDRKKAKAQSEAKSTPERRNSNVPSVEKALDVLELLANSKDGLTIQTMTIELNRTMGELYRIVVYLAERNYIVRDRSNDRYMLTMRLFELAHRQNPTNRLIKATLPYLERVSFRTEQSCHLAILQGSSVLVLASEPSPRHAGYAVRTGAVIPTKNTSSGLVVLAHLPKDERSRLLSGYSQLEREQFDSRIEQIRKVGYEERNSSLVHGIKNISVPIFDQTGVIAALTMGFIGQVDQRTSPEGARNELMAAASDISTELGHLKTN